MKTFNLLFMTITLSFFLSEVYVCNAQYEIIVKGLGFAFKAAAKKAFKEAFKDKNKPDEHGEQMKKLNEITKKIASLEAKMMGRFKELLSTVENISNVTIHGQIANQFENTMIGIQNKLEDLVRKRKRVNRNELELNERFSVDLTLLQLSIDNYKDDLHKIMSAKDISHDFLSQVKNLANVCKDGMSQVQLLDSFRALYLDTMSKYLIGKHILISLWEAKEKKSYQDAKRELNDEVSRYLIKYGKRFQELMAQSSREYQDCNAHPEWYSIQKQLDSPKCYMAGEGSLSNQIVKFDYGKNKYCDDYVSLQPVKARDGYVVVGAKIEHNANIVYIKIIEGKLLPNGVIDPNSIGYSENPAPEVGAKAFYLKLNSSFFDLSKAVASNDRVITGLSFSLSEDQHVYLDVITKKIDVNTGTFISNTERSEEHEKITSEFPLIRNSHRRYNDTKESLQSVKPNQYVKLFPGPSISYSELVFWPIFDVSDVFPTPLTLLSGAGLYVNKIARTQGFLSIRLFTFDIAPHMTDLDFNLDEDFANALKNV